MLFSAERHSQRPCALSDTLRVPGAQSGPGALSGSGASSGSGQGRGSRGQCGQLAFTTWKLWGRPQLSTVNVVHFYFCLFLHVNLGLSKK